MANRIKGITIEIDGNTTKLDKALESTDKQLKNTQASLKDVNKLLKMDPGNAELLAQKQRLLADAVSGTGQRLETLRKAAEDADAALARGNAYAEKYGQLDEELDKVSASYKELKKQKEEMDAALARGNEYTAKYGQLDEELAKVSASYKNLQKQKEEMDSALATGKISTEEYEQYAAKVQETGVQLKELSAQKKEADKEFQGTKIDQNQYDQYAAKVQETREQLEQLRDRKREADKEFSGARIDQSQYDALQRELIEAEQAYQAAAKAAKSFNASAAEIQATADKVSAGAGKIADATKGISTAAGAAAAGLVAMAAKAGLAADDLNTLAKQSGFDTQTLQEWTYAADLVDVSVDSIVSAAQKMKKNMASNSKDVQAAFAQLEVGVSKATIEMKNADVMFYQVVNGLNKIDDEAERTALSMMLLGKPVEQLANFSAKQAVSEVNTLRNNVVNGSEDVLAALENMGISVDNVSFQLRDSEEVFYEVLEALSKIPNETTRDVLAMQIFGKSADELAGIIDDGGAALRELGQEARDAGLILSQDALDGANAFNDGLDRIKARASATFMEAGASLAENLLPVLSDLVDIMGTVLSFIGSLDGRILKFILTITMVVAVISPIAKIISSISGAISGVTSVASLFSATSGNSVYATFLKWSLIIVAVVAALTALVALISVLTGKSGEVERTLNSLGNYSTSSIGGLSGGYQRTGPASYGLNSTLNDLPHLAAGALAKRNNPFLAVVGDNKTQDEVISPYSTIVDAVMEGNARSGGGVQSITLNVNGDLAALFRLFRIGIKIEDSRLGPSLEKT